MGDCMAFPQTIEEFIKDYSFKDSKEEYTNGAELIPTFRVEQALEHYRKNRCKDCAGCTVWKCDDWNVRAKAIDEAIEVSAKAICIGCGYLEGHKCTYKGGNCTVSKPMLEVVVKALEQMKEGAV